MPSDLIRAPDHDRDEERGAIPPRTKRRRCVFAASVYLVREAAEVYLVRHKRTGLLLPPGGELLPDEEPVAAAVRELYEETGWAKGVVLDANPFAFDVLADPGDRGVHMIFAFWGPTPSDVPPRLNMAEVYGGTWITPWKASALGVPANVVANMHRAIRIESELELRPTVRAFARAMERKLRDNDHKGGWKEESPAWLCRRLSEETCELQIATLRAEPSRVLEEAADVANFAMMVADVCGALETGEGTPCRSV